MPTPGQAADKPDEPDHVGRDEVIEHEVLEHDVLEHDVEAELAGAEHPVRRQRRWPLLLRLAISIGLVWYLVRRIADVSFADLLPEPTASTFAWLGVALALTLAGVVLAAARWAQVLKAMGMTGAPFGRLVSHYFAGQFVSNVLPSTIGGDVLRAARLAGDTGDAADSFASLLVERLTGWLVLPLLTVAGLLLDPDVRGTGEPATVAAVLSGLTVVGLAALLYAADHSRLGGRFAEHQGWRRLIGSVHLGVSHLRRHPRPALGVVLVGAVYQLVLVAAAVAAARALGIEAGATTLLAVYPSVLMAQVLPIGISGLGLREGALVFFLAPLGVPNDQAVALGLLLFTLTLVVSLAGAPAFLTGGRRPVGAG